MRETRLEEVQLKSMQLHNEEQGLIQTYLNNDNSKFYKAKDDVVRKIQQVVLVTVMY